MEAANRPGNPSAGLPPEFLQRLLTIVPASELNSVLDSFGDEKAFSFRVNSLVAPVEQTLNQIRELGVSFQAVPWLTDEQDRVIAFCAERKYRDPLTHSALAETGQIYLQNLSSMIAPWVLQAQPHEKILDLAAAPGGKTTQLAQQMNNLGQLSAVEAVRSRMFKLKANLTRCGVTNCKTYLTDGRTVGHKTPARFDRVLLDAPCSSESRFRRDDPASWETWSLRKLRETSRKQVGLLKAAIHATQIGGIILYCTCSFAPEENEQVVEKALRSFGDAIELVEVTLPLSNVQSGLTQWNDLEFSPQLSRSLRILPNQLNDGFFLAKFVKHKHKHKS